MKIPRFLDTENPLEKEIETKVCSYAERRGMLQRKYANPNRRAAPDRLFILPRAPWPYVFFIEFKSRGLQPTPAQKNEHDTYRRFGMSVFVVDNVESGRDLIDQIVGYAK